MKNFDHHSNLASGQIFRGHVQKCPFYHRMYYRDGVGRSQVISRYAARELRCKLFLFRGGGGGGGYR